MKDAGRVNEDVGGLELRVRENFVCSILVILSGLEVSNFYSVYPTDPTDNKYKMYSGKEI